MGIKKIESSNQFWIVVHVAFLHFALMEGMNQWTVQLKGLFTSMPLVVDRDSE